MNDSDARATSPTVPNDVMGMTPPNAWRDGYAAAMRSVEEALGAEKEIDPASIDVDPTNMTLEQGQYLIETCEQIEAVAKARYRDPKNPEDGNPNMMSFALLTTFVGFCHAHGFELESVQEFVKRSFLQAQAIEKATLEGGGAPE